MKARRDILSFFHVRNTQVLECGLYIHVHVRIKGSSSSISNHHIIVIELLLDFVACVFFLGFESLLVNVAAFLLEFDWILEEDCPERQR